MRLTWFGHSAFRVEFGAVRIMIDPFIPNPTYKGNAREAAAGCTHVLVTHGHNDHVGAAVEISRATGAQVVGAAELCDWFVAQGIAGNKVNPGNHGGTVDCGGFSVSFVNALHSSSYGGDEGAVYLGNPLGLIVAAEGQPTLYHLGDTGIFGDMQLIGEIYRPEIGLVPIGDRYTMGARLAAMACKRFFKFRIIVPCHYGTFAALDQSPDKFRAELGADADKLLVPERGKPVEL